MEISRRYALTGLVGVGLAACSRQATGGAYPSHPLRMMVPFPPGGPTDLVGRTVASELEGAFRQPVIVDNRPGASGSIGSEQVLQRAADGYTLCLGNNASHASYEVLHPDLAPYNTLHDFAPISLIGFTQTIMAVHPGLPVHNLREFVAYAKANPDSLNYGSPAFGSAPQLACELLKQTAGINMQLVNYSGTSPTMLALTAGEVHVYMGGASSVKPLIDAGRIRGIAVMSRDRAPELPNLPTSGEEGYPQVVWDSWYGILAAAGVPQRILDLQNATINRMMDTDKIAERLHKFGLRRKLGSRDDFRRVIEEEVALTRKVALSAGLAPHG